jgi:hypothetical protein
VTRTHALATLAAAGLLLTATAAPAAAGELTVVDAPSDVWGAADATNATPSPSIREGDITKAKVIYEDDRATVRIGFARLARKGAFAQFAVRFQGSRGDVVREVVVESSRRNRSGSVRVFNNGGQPVGRCEASHDVDYRRDKVKVTVDRRCLDRSRKVRVNVNTAFATRTGVFYSDNLHDTAAASVAWTDWVRRSH